jgi:hypothetical protein
MSRRVSVRLSGPRQVRNSEIEARLQCRVGHAAWATSWRADLRGVNPKGRSKVMGIIGLLVVLILIVLLLRLI